MRLRRTNEVARIVELEDKIRAALENADRLRAEAANAMVELEGLAREEASGAITAAVAAKRVDEVLARQKDAAAKAEHADRVVEHLRAELVGANRDADRARFQASASEAESAGGAAVEIAREFAGLLAQAAAVGEKLLAAREAADAKYAAAAELVVDGVSLDYPQDEPDWPDGMPALLELIRAGARQPRATAELSREAMRLQLERNERGRFNEAVAQIVRHGIDGSFGQAYRGLDTAARRRVLDVAERQFGKFDEERRARGELVVKKLRAALIPPGA